MGAVLACPEPGLPRRRLTLPGSAPGVLNAAERAEIVAIAATWLRTATHWLLALPGESAGFRGRRLAAADQALESMEDELALLRQHDEHDLADRLDLDAADAYASYARQTAQRGGGVA